MIESTIAASLSTHAAALLLACSMPAAAQAIASPICQQLNKSAKPRALLMDDAGKIARNGFELGELDMRQHTKGAEFKSFKRKYQLILSPARLKLENDCNMSVCIRVRKSRPLCRSTSQYEITVAVLPWKFGPRRFSIEPTLEITDPAARHDEMPELLFKPVAVGTVSMPWLAVAEASASHADALARLAAGGGSATVTLVNTGNRPISIGPWLPDQGAETGQIHLDAPACSARPLQAGQSCQATLRRSGTGALKQSVYTWTNDLPGHPYSTTFSLVQMERGEILLDVINR